MVALQEIGEVSGLRGEIMPDPRCDEEVAQIMVRLDKLQGWLVMKGCQLRGDAEYMSASRLVQDTRVLIVERCFKRPAPAQGIVTEGEDRADGLRSRSD